MRMMHSILASILMLLPAGQATACPSAQSPALICVEPLEIIADEGGFNIVAHNSRHNVEFNAIRSSQVTPLGRNIWLDDSLGLIARTGIQGSHTPERNQ